MFAQLSQDTATNVVGLDISLIQLACHFSIQQGFLEHVFLLIAFRSIRIILTFPRINFLSQYILTIALE